MWCVELCLNLIEIFKELPVLLDPSNKGHFYKKIDAYSQIGKHMNLHSDHGRDKNKIVHLLAT